MMEFTTNKPLRVFEAFAGYGSQSMALARLKHDNPGFDFEIIGISEISKTAIRAYAAVHGSHIPNYGDIYNIHWDDVPGFDLLTYSFPCQDISNAGKQRGFAQGTGTRSSLLWECAKAIEAKRPKYLLMENVKALIQKKFMPDFNRWIDWLESQGYRSFYQVMNAKHYGVPQNRERVFMVSILDLMGNFRFPEPFPLEKKLRDILEDEVDEKYYLSDDRVQKIIDHCHRKQAEGCGFKTQFQSIVKPGPLPPLSIEFIPGGTIVSGTVEQDYFTLRLSRPCSLIEFTEAFVKQAPIFDSYGATIMQTDGVKIKFDKKLDETYSEINIATTKCEATSGIGGWYVTGVKIENARHVSTTILPRHGQRETDTYLKEPK